MPPNLRPILSSCVQWIVFNVDCVEAELEFRRFCDCEARSALEENRWSFWKFRGPKDDNFGWHWIFVVENLNSLLCGAIHLLVMRLYFPLVCKPNSAAIIRVHIITLKGRLINDKSPHTEPSFTTFRLQWTPQQIRNFVSSEPLKEKVRLKRRKILWYDLLITLWLWL